MYDVCTYMYIYVDICWTYVYISTFINQYISRYIDINKKYSKTISYSDGKIFTKVSHSFQFIINHFNDITKLRACAFSIYIYYIYQPKQY